MPMFNCYLMEDRGEDGKLVTAKSFATKEAAMAMPRGFIWRLLWKHPVDKQLDLVAHQCSLRKPGVPRIVSLPRA